jgi:hypothetical protein
MRESRSSGSVGEREGDDLLYPEVVNRESYIEIKNPVFDRVF